MADAPKGWYPNPEDELTERWWDGYRWTDATRPATPPVPDPPSVPPPPTVPDPPTEDWSDLSMFRQPPQPPGPPQTFRAPANMNVYRPESRLVWSILVTLFCCLPFGIAAIVNSAKVDSLWAAGDYIGSARASEQAKKWITWSVIVGIIAAVLGLLGAAMGEPETTYTYGAILPLA